MADRLLLTRVDGQVAQIPAGDALRLRGALNEPLPDNQTAAAEINIGVPYAQTINVGAGTPFNITSLGSNPVPVGVTRRVAFSSGGSVLKNNGVINLPAGDIPILSGDVFEFLCINTFPIWKLISYMRGDGTPLVGAPDPTKLPLAGGQMTGPLNEAYGSASTSSGIITFGANGNSAFVGGSVGDMIYGIADPAVTASGAVRRIVFVAPGMVLVHSNNLTLPTHANITVQNGDAMIVQADGATSWRCISYQRADGTALVSSGSGSPATYTFTQSSALAVWTIPHNLNRFPSVTVVDTLGNVIVPDISYVDSNTVQVTHGAAYAGKAYLN